MRHRKSRFQLNRFTGWRRATVTGLAKNLVVHQRIRTTLNKAKAARPLAEKLVSLAKSNTLADKRYAYKILGDHKLVSVLFEEIAPLFKKRNSGYVRIVQLGLRRGDNAQLALLEFTEIKKEVKEHKKEKEAKKEIEKPSEAKEKPVEEKVVTKPEVQPVSEKPPIEKKPSKKFLGGLRKIFKKERDSL